MKNHSLLWIFLVGLVCAGPAEAHSRKAKHHAHKRDYAHSRYAGGSDFRDHLRAESCDAGGQYRGYPDWARAAFTCGRSR